MNHYLQAWKMLKNLFCLSAAFSLLAILFPCRSACSAAEPAAESAVKNVLQTQAEAWNNGDLDKFMTGYVKSKDCSFASSNGEVWGYEAIQARYKTRYGSKKSEMGKLNFSDLKVIDLGPSNALCIGHWNLELEGKDPLAGIFSLVFVKTKEGWKIIHDHTSVSQKNPS